MADHRVRPWERREGTEGRGEGEEVEEGVRVGVEGREEARGAGR